MGLADGIAWEREHGLETIKWSNPEKQNKEPIAWRSVAIWPYPAVDLSNHNNSSSDDHSTEQYARSICNRLRSRGFGGEGKIFPIELRVEPVYK